MSSEDLMDSILGEIAAPPRIEPGEQMSSEEKEARGKAAMAVILGDKLGLGRALNDDEMRVALAIQEKQLKNKQLVGGGGNVRRMMVDDGGIGLGQIMNFKADSPYVDEVDKYLIDKAKGMQAAGGDEFYGRIAMKQGRQVALNDEAEFKRINPVSVLDGILGNQVTLKHGDEKIVARWDGKDAETVPVTITVGAVETDGIVLTGPGTPRFRPYAIIQWGTSGYLVSARIDVGRGTQLTVNASTVIVTLGLITSNASLGTNASKTIKLTGMLSFHPCVRTAPITCTQWDVIPSTESVQNVVPAFAKNVQVYRNNATYAIVIAMINYGGVTLYSVTRAAALAIDAETVMDPIPIPDDVAFVTVTNNGIASVSTVLVYELAL